MTTTTPARLAIAALLALALLAPAAWPEPEPEAERARRMELTGKALQGDVEAAFELGQLYQLRGDYAQACTWFGRGMAADHVPSTWRLARLLEEGWGGKRRLEEARQAYVKLTLLKEKDAWYHLGRLYESPSSPFLDLKAALLNYRDGALAGDVRAQLALAVLFLKGTGDGKVDHVQAFHWFSEAAKARSPVGMRYLGLCYRLGLGVDVDRPRSWDWYRKAADAGDPESMFILGAALEEGTELPRDPQMARVFFERAAERGYSEARKRLERK